MITSAIRLMVVALKDMETTLSMLPQNRYRHEDFMAGHIAYFLRMYWAARLLCGLRIRLWHA